MLNLEFFLNTEVGGIVSRLDRAPEESSTGGAHLHKYTKGLCHESGLASLFHLKIVGLYNVQSSARRYIYKFHSTVFFVTRVLRRNGR
jgi:hypothetical protein